MENREECTCDFKHNHAKSNKLSFINLFKRRLSRKKAPPEKESSEKNKSSSDDENGSFSRASSGIGTLSTKSKMFQDDSMSTVKDGSSTSLGTTSFMKIHSISIFALLYCLNENYVKSIFRFSR